MHELAMAHNILSAVIGTAETHGGLRVRQVNLCVGQLAQVVPETLAFNFQVISRDTLADGAELNVVEVPLAWACRSCGAEQTEATSACPACGSLEIERKGAHEIVIESVDMEDVEEEATHG